MSGISSPKKTDFTVQQVLLWLFKGFLDYLLQPRMVLLTILFSLVW